MGLSIGTGVRLDLIRDPVRTAHYIGRPTSATERSGAAFGPTSGARMRRSPAWGPPSRDEH